MDHNEERVCKTDISETVVPYIMFESAQARSERTIKRLIIALIMTILLLFLSNVVWLNMWNEYEFDGYYYEQDGEGLNSINFGTQGDVRNEPSINNPQAEEETTGNE